jgi:hypothetical protein
MPLSVCQWCQAPIYPAGTGRPARYCSPRCRQADRRSVLLQAAYPEPWQRKALAQGWQPPDRPR